MMMKLRHASDRFDSQNYSSFSCAERYVSLIQPAAKLQNTPQLWSALLTCVGRL